MSLWSVYDAATGVLTGRFFDCPEDVARGNTPAGCALYAGKLDHTAQKVDITTNQPVPFQGPSPGPGFMWDGVHWVFAPGDVVLSGGGTSVSAAADNSLAAQVLGLQQALVSGDLTAVKARLGIA
jgi:hypothetical protein